MALYQRRDSGGADQRSVRAAVCLLFAALASCGTAPVEPDEQSPPLLAVEVRRTFLEQGIGALPAAPAVRAELVELGQALVFDRILSGDRDISCMTCHYPVLGTGDARSLSIGTGGSGLGASRLPLLGKPTPRNSQPLFDLGSLQSLFWDGRIELGRGGEVRTPVDEHLTPEMRSAFEFGAVSAQGMLPVTVREEMRGFGNSDLGAIPDSDVPAIWRALMIRLGAIPEYRRLFEAAYPGTSFDVMTFAHASNAMAGFMLARLTFPSSPWDRFLQGQDDALTPTQLEGAAEFAAHGCTSCHAGAAFTDNGFHNILLPQIGIGRGDGPSAMEDYGRERVTRAPSDRYAFRTPPLRNVQLTGPWGHAGQYSTLHGIIDHHGDPEARLRSYQVAQLEPGLRGMLVDNVEDLLATGSPHLTGPAFEPDVTELLVRFLGSLTHPAAQNLAHLIPVTVPSGLPVD